MSQSSDEELEEVGDENEGTGTEETSGAETPETESEAPEGRSEAGTKDWSEFEGLEGLTSDEGCRALYALALEATSAIVELGVYTGKSICYLGAGSRDGHGVPVWGVDLWDTHKDRVRHKRSMPAQETEVRLKARKQVHDMGLWKNPITLIRDFSAGYPKRYEGPKVDLLFVDADHTRDAVLADFAAWWEHLADEAVIVFDDYSQRVEGKYPEGRVRDAVKKLKKDKWLVEVEEVAGRFAVAKKGTGNA